MNGPDDPLDLERFVRAQQRTYAGALAEIRPCATLFASAAAPGSVFERLLVKYFEGTPDARTVEWLKDSGR